MNYLIKANHHGGWSYLTESGRTWTHMVANAQTFSTESLAEEKLEETKAKAKMTDSWWPDTEIVPRQGAEDSEL